VCFVHNPKQSNIFSLIVTMLNLFVQQYILPLIFKSIYLFCIYLRIGQMQRVIKTEANIDKCCCPNLGIVDK
jgi:hypothetical protein